MSDAEQAGIDGLHAEIADWQALARELAEVVTGAIEELSCEGYDVTEEKATLARYHAATAQ